MKDFILDNWKDLVFLFCLVLELFFFVIGVFSKKKKEPSVFSSILACLPVLIKNAECLIGAGNGIKKLEYVLNQVNSIIKQQTGQEMNSSERVVFTRYIEEILQTPQRKET